MNREIGSEFWEIPLSGQENYLFPVNTRWYRSGRTALGTILDHVFTQREIRTMALPSWCCETMVEPFLSRGIQVRFYAVTVDEQGRLCQQLPDPGWCDGILVMDYFGYARQGAIPQGWGLVIRDVTHSLFCGVPSDADYVYGSLRKWAGFWTGGFAWGSEPLPASGQSLTEADDYVVLRRQAMAEKARYLSGQLEEKRHLALFAAAEAFLNRNAQGVATPEDVFAARHLDVSFMRERRRQNAAQLLDHVRDYALFPGLRAEDCPLFVPIVLPHETRDALRRYLIEQEIYCPVHWPLSPLHRCEGAERCLYDESMSLVCDQRYDAKDMQRLCQAVDHFLKGNR